MHSVDDVDSVRLGIRNLLLHETTEPGKVGCDAGDSHDRAFCGGVTPRFVVGGENAHVTTANKLLVI